MAEHYETTRLDTTIGDLIEAVSQVAFEYSDNAAEAYLLARLALVEILKTASVPPEGDSTPGNRISKKQYLH